MNYQITELLSNNFSILVGQASASILALLLERLLVVPRIHMKRWCFKIASMHFCLISFFYYVLLLISGKVIFTVIMVLALLLILIIVNNAKYKNLQEPLVFSDYDYFTDAFKFPRLYIPFLGFSGILGIAIGIMLVIFGYIQDSSAINRFDLEDGLGLSVIWLVIGSLYLQLNIRVSKLVTFNPREDLNNLGFAMYLWCYFIEYLKKPYPVSKFEFLTLKKANYNNSNNTATSTSVATSVDDSATSIKGNNDKPYEPYETSDISDVSSNKPSQESSNELAKASLNVLDSESPNVSPNVLPHLVAIQSESFFDPRDWNSNIKEEVLETFDSICKESRLSGKLSVPAFGANTIRTEFSFLTGVAPATMKGHQFSPYQIMARKSFELKSFVNLLKSQGYYTVCIHPYYKKFYNRDIIFNKWGFDAFLDIDIFDKTVVKGAYISDEAITLKILSILKQKKGMPIFIFAITMEKHGPMHLEKISEEEFNQYYKNDADKKLVDYDLSVYLNHLHNADKMLKDLTNAFKNTSYPISLAFYGDHIPIMPTAYKNIGVPSGKVPYFIWDNHAFISAFLNNKSETNKTNIQKDLNNENLNYENLNSRNLKDGINENDTNEVLKVDLKIEDLSVTWLSSVTK